MMKSSKIKTTRHWLQRIQMTNERIQKLEDLLTKTRDTLQYCPPLNDKVRALYQELHVQYQECHIYKVNTPDEDLSITVSTNDARSQWCDRCDAKDIVTLDINAWYDVDCSSQVDHEIDSVPDNTLNCNNAHRIQLCESCITDAFHKAKKRRQDNDNSK